MHVAGLPAFVIGYHGTDRSIAEALFSGKEKDLIFSDNDYDWLGSGLYFWENSWQRGLEWATQFVGKKRKGGKVITEPAVVGAVIDLGHCLNLLDQQAIQLVQDRYSWLVAQCHANGTQLPKNENPDWMQDSTDRIYRKLDCAVIRSIHDLIKDAGLPAYDSVRAVFLEGKPVYKDSGFLEKTHIQICVRKPERIIGYFRPRTGA